MKEGKDSSGELRLRDEERGNDFEMEMKGDKDIMLGIDSKAKTDEETIHYPRKNQESDEIAALKSELRQVKMERDILKKSLTLFGPSKPRRKQ